MRKRVAHQQESAGRAQGSNPNLSASPHRFARGVQPFQVAVLAHVILAVLFAGLSIGCSPSTASPTSTNGMIEPGAKVGDMLVTKGEVGDITYHWQLPCARVGQDENYSCQATVGTKVNVSVGIYDDTGTGKLEEYWSGHTYELAIESRPVNLQSFGSIDAKHPWLGTMRHWNVVIVADQPGEITIHESGTAHGDSFTSNVTYVFSK